jgi:hypothetical protein
MKITRTNSLTKAPGMSGYAIPLKAGIPHLLWVPVPDIFPEDHDTVLPANTEEPGLLFSICGRRLTRLPPRIETRCIAGHPGTIATVIPEVA